MDDTLQRSKEIILEYQAPSGAYPASPTFAAYTHSWFRDGAYIADAMSRAGEVESAERFFDWCAGIIGSRREKIESGGQLDTRFTTDGKEVEAEWANYQLDGYGLWLWALKGHHLRHDRDIARFDDAANLTLLYLQKHWQEPCYDWWEERYGIHAATLACICAGFRVYNYNEAFEVQHKIDLARERVDGSLLACPLLDVVSMDDFAPTLSAIERELVSISGGVYRYNDDSYYGGGEWLLLTAMLGQVYAKAGQRDKAQEKLEWVLARKGPNGWLPEQVQDNLLHPEAFAGWKDRLGPPAVPLLWAHAAYINLALDLQPVS